MDKRCRKEKGYRLNLGFGDWGDRKVQFGVEVEVEVEAEFRVSTVYSNAAKAWKLSLLSTAWTGAYLAFSYPNFGY